MHQLKGSRTDRGNNPPLLCLSVLSRPSTDWRRPTHTREGICLLSLQTSILSSSRNTLPDTPRIMFYRVSGHLCPSQADT